MPEDAEVWRDVASSSETRIGAGCEHFEECFVTRMRREAEDAQIVVVEPPLAPRRPRASHGPPRRRTRASCLPYDAIVFDEAHQVEDVATDFFGVRVSSARVEAFVRDAERALGAANALEALKSGPVRLTLESAREAGRALFARLLLDASAGAADSAPDAPRDADVTPAVRDAHGALDVRLEALEGIARSRGKDEALLLIGRRASELRDDLRSILAGTWVDGRRRGVRRRAVDRRALAQRLARREPRRRRRDAADAALRSRPDRGVHERHAGDRDELPLRQVAPRRSARGRRARRAVALRLRLAGRALPAGRPARARRPAVRRRRDRPDRRAREHDRRRRVRPLHVDARDAGALGAGFAAASACR